LTLSSFAGILLAAVLKGLLTAACAAHRTHRSN
jgi:hypothetical protein